MLRAKNILWLPGAEDTKTKWYLRACSPSVRSVCMLCERCLIKGGGGGEGRGLTSSSHISTSGNREEYPDFPAAFCRQVFQSLLFCLPLFYGAVKRGNLGGGEGAKRQHTWVYSGWSPYLSEASSSFYLALWLVHGTGLPTQKKREEEEDLSRNAHAKVRNMDSKVSESYGRFREAPLEEILLQNFGL